MSEGESKK